MAVLEKKKGSRISFWLLKGSFGEKIVGGAKKNLLDGRGQAAIWSPFGIGQDGRR